MLFSYNQKCLSSFTWQQHASKNVEYLERYQISDMTCFCCSSEYKHGRLLCRCYTFGIGQGACRRLIQGLATVSRGAAEFLAEGERLQPKVFIHSDMFSCSECHCLAIKAQP